MSIKMEAESSSSASASASSASRTLLRSHSPSQSISLQSSIPSLSSLTDLSGIESNASTPRRTSRIKRKRDPDYRSESSIFVVSHILARSFEQSVSPNGSLEYQYLVRWEGYGPQDDTWEYTSNFIGSAGMLIRDFDSKPHPVTIVESSFTFPTKYLVRYCYSTSSIAPSPICITEWQTALQMRRIGGLEKEYVDQVIANHANYEQVDSSLQRSARSRLGQVRKDKSILSVVERADLKRKTNSQNRQPKYRVRWKDRKTIKEVWMWYEQIVKNFGENGKIFLKQWNEEMGYTNTKKAKPVEAGPLSEYEQERKNNMASNLDLMKQLGLST
ncbi:uncharacterized protein I303_104643 [Kwoniella dejecticola CBS 10117]|uniref:Chromo domain-containing protein n=1 Tax=Kwoniella dejecticola CBS 10117 TaxID=1296121 RepID=A0A1A6A4R3_9TREE|nr:uncharacterized protein I303_04377 [Kwoniella dejecticola CBS 10117]OBR85049.1 hypothetical protein I303_04377 [Kwoniella dejecticola CBS 10117]